MILTMLSLKVEIFFENEAEHLSLKSVKTRVNKKLKNDFLVVVSIL